MSSYRKMQDLSFRGLHFCLPLGPAESYPVFEVPFIYFYVQVYVLCRQVAHPKMLFNPFFWAKPVGSPATSGSKGGGIPGLGAPLPTGTAAACLTIRSSYAD